MNYFQTSAKTNIKFLPSQKKKKKVDEKEKMKYPPKEKAALLIVDKELNLHR